MEIEKKGAGAPKEKTSLSAINKQTSALHLNLAAYEEKKMQINSAYFFSRFAPFIIIL